ncbi:MAG TPA: hypothetical protein ENI87_07920 [bacterium]|nr:hypothetical protein [bacterium]
MAKKSKPKPKKRIWRALLLTVLGLGVFLLMFVSAFVFNPFEGALPELRDVVPRGVNFFVRKRGLAADFDPFPEPRFWPALSAANGFDAVENGPLGRAWGPELRKAADSARQAADEVRRATGGWVDLLDDIVGREVVVAGYTMDYSAQPPRPLAEPHWCVYTRVSWKIKAAYGMAGFGFVAGMAADQGVQIANEDDLLVITLPGQPGPIYVKRFLDVLMVANGRKLLDQAQALILGNRDEEPIGQQPAYTDGAVARIDEWARDNDVADPNVLEFLVEPNAFDGFQRYASRWPNPQNPDSMNERVLASFLNLKGWTQVTGGLLFADGVLGATGEVGLNSKQHTQFQSSFYTTDKQRRAQWLDDFLRMVPESSCAAAALRVPAGDFLHAMFDALEPDEKSLINDALRRATFQGTQVRDVRDLVDRIRIAFQSRTGFVFRRNQPDTSRDKETGELLVPVTAKSPMPQVAWVFWLRPNGAPLVEELVTMLRTYYSSFGFRKVWHLKVPIGNSGATLPEPVTEFTNPQIPATGEIAMIVFRDFFVVSNSGPLIRDILRTRYGVRTGARSIRESREYDEVERELSDTLSGLVWLDGPNLEPVFDDYLAFADQSSVDPDPKWMMDMRPSAEDAVRRRDYPRYPSISSMPKSLTEPGGEFDRRVVAYMREQWARTRTSFTAADRLAVEQLRGLARMMRAAAVQVELANNYIRYQVRVMTDVR